MQQQHLVYELIVQDDLKLKQFHSMQTDRQSFSTDYLPKVEAVGYTQRQLATQLENLLKQPFVSVSHSNERIDVSLDISSSEKVKASLQFHGLDLRPSIKLIDIIDIHFY